MIHYVIVSILSLLALVTQGIFAVMANSLSGGGVVGNGASPLLINVGTLVVGGLAIYFMVVGWLNYFKGNQALAVGHLNKLAYWIFYPCVLLVGGWFLMGYLFAWGK